MEIFEAQQRKIPERINRYLDVQGRLKELPPKQGKRLAVLAYVATKFDLEREHTEKEVNTICNVWHSFGDYFIVRRELVDAGFLQRKPDGSSYWREAPLDQLSALFTVDTLEQE